MSLFPPEFLDARARYRAFMEEHVYPNERALSTDDQELIRSLQAKVKEAGLWAPHVPPEAGGTGQGFLAYAHQGHASKLARRRFAQPGAIAP